MVCFAMVSLSGCHKYKHKTYCILIYIGGHLVTIVNLKRSALLEKNPLLSEDYHYSVLYLACISLVYAMLELLSVFTEYLEPSCFCFSPLPNLKAGKARA